MLGLLQRVRRAQVTVEGQTVGAIGPGFLLLVCAEPDDGTAQADKLLDKLIRLRVFSDEAGKMNRSLQDIDGQGTQGGLLIVSQFTLAADTSAGNRPGFTRAAAPADARRLYDYLVTQAQGRLAQVQTGRFGTEMQVELVNDGPVTIPLRMAPPTAAPRTWPLAEN